MDRTRTPTQAEVDDAKAAWERAKGSGGSAEKRAEARYHRLRISLLRETLG